MLLARTIEDGREMCGYINRAVPFHCFQLLACGQWPVGRTSWWHEGCNEMHEEYKGAVVHSILTSHEYWRTSEISEFEEYSWMVSMTPQRLDTQSMGLTGSDGMTRCLFIENACIVSVPHPAHVPHVFHHHCYGSILVFKVIHSLLLLVEKLYWCCDLTPYVPWQELFPSSVIRCVC